jgi:hypothetical protein
MEMASLSADRVLLLGPLQVIRNGSPLLQPPSRKVRALLAYLAIAARPVSREKLCELLWDVADDPRGELRWCLSKLRPLVDGPAATRLIADRKQVQIEADALDVDALRVARETQAALSSGSTSDLRSLLALFRGDFLEGLSVEGRHRSKTGSPASATALANCANNCWNALALYCRLRIASKCCASSSRLGRSMKPLTSRLFAR